ncbi:UNVERIFIED_CONTAM: hypothetical protein HDU68_010076 [Siphonaria sp. JEL0065]|nr:hypothetical protein HDU68_010076 [Siphonaria sp. JEL0065]
MKPTFNQKPFYVLLSCLGIATLFWVAVSTDSTFNTRNPSNVDLNATPIETNTTTKRPLNLEANLGMSQAQCLSEFPRLFESIDKQVLVYRKRGGVFRSDIEKLSALDTSQLHIVIKNGRIYLKKFKNTHPYGNRALSVLSHLHDILSYSSSTPIPDVEFVVDCTDYGSASKPGGLSFTRKTEDELTWLIPDFGFQAWPEVGLLSYTDMRSDSLMYETNGPKKVEKLLWRGAPMTDSRKELLELAKEPWADVQELKWSCLKTPDEEGCRDFVDYKTIPQHCGYKYLMQTEGHSYSGRFKLSVIYLLNCKSLTLVDKLDWDQHFHHLLNHDPTSPTQNMILVPPPIKQTLPKVMKELLRNHEKTNLIIENSWNALRNRYLTPAANACYWRYLLSQYATVLEFEPSLELGKGRGGAGGTGKAAPYEAFNVMRTVDWEIA